MRSFTFDLHNTLVKNNDLVVTSAINSILARRGIDVRVEVDYIRNFQARLKPLISYIGTILPNMKKEEVEEITIETRKLCEQEFIEKYIQPMDHADEVLKTIKEHNDMIAVLSFSTLTSIEIYLKRAGLMQYIDRIIGIEERQELEKKSDPALIKATLLKEYLANLKYEQAYFIGDSVYDVNAGRMIGVRTIYFTMTGEVLDQADYNIDDLRSVLDIAYGRI